LHWGGGRSRSLGFNEFALTFILGAITLDPTLHHFLFQLPTTLILGRGQPLLFRLGRGHLHHFPRLGPGQFAGREALLEAGKLIQCLGQTDELVGFRAREGERFLAVEMNARVARASIARMLQNFDEKGAGLAFGFARGGQSLEELLVDGFRIDTIGHFPLWY